MIPKESTHSFSFLEHLAAKSHQIVFSYNVDKSVFEYLNDACESILQTNKEVLFTDSANILNAIHPEDVTYVHKAYEEIMNGEQRQDIEFRLLLPDQAIRWLCLTPYYLPNVDDKVLISGFAEDITARKAYNEVLKKYAAKKNSVLEILSHDLAGPLANIQGLTTVLSKKWKGKENATTDFILDSISKTCERSIRLIRDFVKHEFLESAGVELVKSRVNIKVVILEIIEQYKYSEQDIDKTFHLNSSSDELYVYIDEIKFSQVINNLISNAIKFTHEKGIISTTITEQENSILITVQDNGIGIPKSLQEGLFEKFNKARRPGVKGEPSVGLGMSIIKTIVEWHNGKIWFESEENVGSTFFIEISKKGDKVPAE